MAADFLEKSATVLKVPEVEDEEDGAGLEELLKLKEVPNNSEIPRDAAAVEAAMEAIINAGC